jgi:hypothetical protein
VPGFGSTRADSPPLVRPSITSIGEAMTSMSAIGRAERRD